jgi:hypothetical protein
MNLREFSTAGRTKKEIMKTYMASVLGEILITS